MLRAWLQRRRAARPEFASLLEQAQTLHRAGKFDGAAKIYEQVLALAPENTDALILSARLEGRRGRLDLARSRLESALARNPNLARAHADLGNVLRLSGDDEGAKHAYETALALDPALAATWNNLGLIRLARGEVESAANAFAEALARETQFGEALRNLVNAKAKLGRYNELKIMLEALLLRDAASAEAHAALGFVELKGFGAPGCALAHFERARELGLNNAELLVNRGISLHDLGRIDEAVASYEAAMAIEPEYPLARFHRALARLIEYRFELAWDDYEARVLSAALPVRQFAFPRWDGGELSGKTLLILAEQGLGDEIMFASCYAEVIAGAGHCVIDCAVKLAPIMRRSFPQATVHGGTQFDPPQWLTALTRPDLQIDAGSLLRLFRSNLDAFPQHQGYLIADPQKIAAWRSRLAALGGGLKVGVSWRGGTAKSRSGMRSLTLDSLAPIFAVPGVRFVSLQYDAHAEEVTEFNARTGTQVHHFQDAIDDYDETAALVASLDLVISVCTAVIHLGGALGTPVWVIAPKVPEWRYGIRGEAMPWYPGNRVLRQTAAGEWNDVIRRVAVELAAVAAAAAQ